MIGDDKFAFTTLKLATERSEWYDRIDKIITITQRYMSTEPSIGRSNVNKHNKKCIDAEKRHEYKNDNNQAYIITMAHSHRYKGGGIQ